ncbi:MAG: winged helix DNA-binding domain-containing protein [Anaerolineae bacterium]|nr:winged helix DNA-binding domain-containing protein [Anaerolineae bacterium]
MANNQYPPASLKLSSKQARRFLLAHHGLWPPRKLKGKEGILTYIDRVGCVQYDTINVVGRNADLVMQSRVKGYRPEMLAELLYQDRKLWDGTDKVASLYRIEDYPYFARRREYMMSYPDERFQKALAMGPKVLKAIRERGPLSSIDFDDDEERLDWFWGNPTKLTRAALEAMLATGKLGVHHKVGTRRIYDLTERLLGEEIAQAPDPHNEYDDYIDWHIYRRVGGLGLAHPGAGERWLGIYKAKSPERRAAYHRLVEDGSLVAAEVEGIEKETFFLRREVLDVLEKVSRGRQPRAQAAFIAPLDNMMWDRRTIEWLFGFEYVWEVYKPKAKREYGYYVLPVLYGDKFAARMDAKFDRKAGVLHLNNWWWEKGMDVNESVEKALSSCLTEFMAYLGAQGLQLGAEVVKVNEMDWAKQLAAG